ncbi:MAG: hypothetical protein JW882_01620 [Deltaproteobacteria bacterium]|nr:hypothetical protein [Deltaproteobacteria bacterium]
MIQRYLFKGKNGSRWIIRPEAAFKNYSSLDAHPDLILYKGWFNKKSMEVQIEEKKAPAAAASSGVGARCSVQCLVRSTYVKTTI